MKKNKKNEAYHGRRPALARSLASSRSRTCLPHCHCRCLAVSPLLSLSRSLVAVVVVLQSCRRCHRHVVVVRGSRRGGERGERERERDSEGAIIFVVVV